MLLIGLTGGIGSGKSTVAGIFATLGVPVYYSDKEAKRLMNEDPDLKMKIQKAFGSLAYDKGQLDKKYLSSIVFNNSQKLDLLNSIVHPATLRDATKWIQKQSGAYIIKEAALIFESDAHKMLDYVIGVSAPAELRVQRTMERDNISRNEVFARMEKQLPEDEKMRLCNFVINNDGEHPVIQQVLDLHEKFIRTTFC